MLINRNHNFFKLTPQLQNAILEKYAHHKGILLDILQHLNNYPFRPEIIEFILKYGWLTYKKIMPFIDTHNFDYIVENRKLLIKYLTVKKFTFNMPPQYIFLKFILWKHNLHNIDDRTINFYVNQNFAFMPDKFEFIVEFCKNNPCWLWNFRWLLVFLRLKTAHHQSLLSLNETEKLNLLKNITFIYGKDLYAKIAYANVPIEYFILPLPLLLHSLLLQYLTNDNIIESLPLSMGILLRKGIAEPKLFILVKIIDNVFKKLPVNEKYLNLIRDVAANPQKYMKLPLKLFKTIILQASRMPSRIPSDPSR